MYYNPTQKIKVQFDFDSYEDRKILHDYLLNFAIKFYENNGPQPYDITFVRLPVELYWTHTSNPDNHGTINYIMPIYNQNIYDTWTSSQEEFDNGGISTGYDANWGQAYGYDVLGKDRDYNVVWPD